jgi:hypothetical protein
MIFIEVVWQSEVEYKLQRGYLFCRHRQCEIILNYSAFNVFSVLILLVWGNRAVDCNWWNFSANY